LDSLGWFACTGRCTLDILTQGYLPVFLLSVSGRASRVVCLQGMRSWCILTPGYRSGYCRALVSLYGRILLSFLIVASKNSAGPSQSLLSSQDIVQDMFERFASLLVAYDYSFCYCRFKELGKPNAFNAPGSLIIRVSCLSRSGRCCDIMPVGIPSSSPTGMPASVPTIPPANSAPTGCQHYPTNAPLEFYLGKSTFHFVLAQPPWS
jgi:hypothetical protein